MAECFECGKEYAKAKKEKLLLNFWGLCPECRCNIKIGEMIQKLPKRTGIMRGAGNNGFLYYDYIQMVKATKPVKAETALEALEKGIEK